MVSLKGTLSINEKKRFKVRHHELDRFKVSGPTYWVVFYCLPSLLTLILSSNTSITVKKISKILKEKHTLQHACVTFIGALGTTRTYDPLLRRQLLYPPELRGQRIILYLFLLNFQSYLYAISVSYGIKAVELDNSLWGLIVSKYSL